MTAEAPPPRDPRPTDAALAAGIVTEAQLKAAFLAARAKGKVLDDDVLRAVIVAARIAAIAEW